ncbi:MAG: SDR family oxidoreductase [Cyanobacteria bacterium P01_F01_bin.150]
MKTAGNTVILGCGYVGQRVAQTWLNQGLGVVVTTTTASKVSELEAIASNDNRHPTAVVMQGNDANALTKLLSGQDTLLVSLAPHRGGSYKDTYLATAQTLAQVLPQTSIKQVIYTSSFGVYGNHGGHWVTEETAIAPTTDSRQILADSEKYLLDIASEKLLVCILRLGGIYGPGRELLRIFQRLSGTTADGDGKSPSNWVHVDDIVGSIDFAQAHRLRGIYNVVQDTILSRRDLLDRLFQTYNLPGVEWNPSVAGQRSLNVKVSNQKLRDAGYSFIHTDFWIPADYKLPQT